jgi:hypothetical protein
MVFTIKPGFVPSPERCFHGEIEEVTTRASLETNNPDYLSVIGSWLVL